jgi:beta-lactam-binding protein with PASTA domain
MDLRSSAQRAKNEIVTLAKNKYFWGGLGVLFAIGLVLYALINYLIMPAYTRHNVAIQVPDVLNMQAEDAERILLARDLRVSRIDQQFNPKLPRGVIIDQNPRPNERVKPNRRIFITVNSGREQLVVIPSVEGLSLREAINRLRAVGLEAGEAQPDTLPSPFANTVTRQHPPAGDSLRAGSTVDIWYSTGLGNEFVQVPDVTGLSLAEAKQILTDNRLRYVVIRTRTGEDLDETDTPTLQEEEEIPDNELLVVGQRREAGTRVREGFEIRLFVERADGPIGGEGDSEEIEEPDVEPMDEDSF